MNMDVANSTTVYVIIWSHIVLIDVYFDPLCLFDQTVYEVFTLEVKRETASV